jgi:hypothetical protein
VFRVLKPESYSLGQDSKARSYRLCFAIGFASSRAHSMNSRATGLIVRFLSVMIPIGKGGKANRKCVILV